MHKISGGVENYKYVPKTKYVQNQIFSFSIQFLKPVCLYTQNLKKKTHVFEVGKRYSHLLLKNLFLSSEVEVKYQCVFP